MEMTTVRPLPKSSITRKSTRAKLTQRTSRKLSTDAVNGVISDVTGQSNKDSTDEEFCGEPFADNGELLSSLSPLLFSMKLFGLYFHREHRHRRSTDDPEWNPSKSGSSFSALQIYATTVLIIVWLNAIRLCTLFDISDHFGHLLLMKMRAFAIFNLTAIMFSACYYASHTGKLFRVLLTLPVTLECVRGARWVAVRVTAIMWFSTAVNLSILAYVHFANNGEYDFTAAPFGTYIDVPEDKIMAVRLCSYLTYILIIPGILFSHAMTLVIVYVFCHEFKKLKKNFCRAIGKGGHFNGDLSLFRRRHSFTQ